jgi:hypothetical protein
MQTTLEALWKSTDKLTVGWSKEPVQVDSYNIYISLSPVTVAMTLLKSGVSPYTSENPATYKKVAVDVTIETVRTTLSLPATVNFSNTVFYMTITYVNSLGESPIADSTIIEVLPLGISSKFRRDNPVNDRMMFGFSNDIQKWVKAAVTPSGAIITDTADFFKSNTVTEYAYDGTNVSTMKSYSSDMTAVGSPAKLTSYQYSGSLVTKITVTDSTV